MFYIIGLGNPGDEYERTRHNTGRDAVLKLAKDLKAEDFEFDKKSKSQISNSKIGKEKMVLILPETFMNNSGKAVSYFVKPKLKTAKKGLENLIVMHDDIDLPLGSLKISYNKGLGGHRGLDSVAKAVKTLEFVRVRIGVSPASAKATAGKACAKKPGHNLPPKAAEKAVIDFILSKFKPAEAEIMKKSFKRASEAIQCLITSGRDRAMNEFNS
jgi:peptidyl-tRNA hydrolase, PTH1 family